MSSTLDDRIRQSLGESINPAYVRSLLDMSTPDLLRWLRAQMLDEARMFCETIHLAEAQAPAYRFGLQLHQGHTSLWRFILSELESREDALPSTVEVVP